jgi:hypothetical protein
MEKIENGRRTISLTVRRLLSVAVVITLAVVAANAQVSCLGKCEQDYALCLRNQGNGLSATCLEIYDQCVEACTGAAGLILG